MSLEEILARLDDTIHKLAPIRAANLSHVSPESQLALGEMLGAALRARVSIKRDIQLKSGMP